MPRAGVLVGCLVAGLALWQPAAAKVERRIALVIGNAAYRDAPLANPVNDARAMAAKLAAIGYEVHKVENVGLREMTRAITAFGLKAREGPGSDALFFYAGHGLQVQGRNYLVPVDAEIAAEVAVRSEAVDLDSLLAQLHESGARTNVVILDACRNNPFERRFRGGGRGLAVVDAPRGTFIAYATAPGKVAADGTDSNGVYTGELLKVLGEPGLRIEDVFKRVRVRVAEKTGEAQVPWETSSITGDFYFVPKGSTVTVSPPGAAAVQSAAGNFDGIWSVRHDCTPTTGASGYKLRYFAQVKDGKVSAQHGRKGLPDSLTMHGEILGDGSVLLTVDGFVGDPATAVGGGASGQAYQYQFVARFAGTRGLGRTHFRPCDVEFTRQ